MDHTLSKVSLCFRNLDITEAIDLAQYLEEDQPSYIFLQISAKTDKTSMVHVNSGATTLLRKSCRTCPRSRPSPEVPHFLHTVQAASSPLVTSLKSGLLTSHLTANPGVESRSKKFTTLTIANLLNIHSYNTFC